MGADAKPEPRVGLNMRNEATDEELLAAFYFHDEDDALAVFVARHRRWALGQAALFFAEDAEDIVQLSILRLMDAQPVDVLRTMPAGCRAVRVEPLPQRGTMDQLLAQR